MVSYVSIRTFEDYVMNAMGQPYSSCGNSGSCGHYLLIEADGTAYGQPYEKVNEDLKAELMQHMRMKIIEEYDIYRQPPEKLA